MAGGARAGQASHVSKLLVFDKDGPVENELRYRDECVRHKVLDLVGDLALAGCDLVGHFIAHRSGHRLECRAGAGVVERRRNRRRLAALGVSAEASSCNELTDSPARARMLDRVAKRMDAERLSWPATSPTMSRFIPRAEIDDDVEIGPFCVIGPNVRIGRGTRLENNVTLMGRVTLGEHNHLYPGVVIGGEPQDISYRGSDTQVIIGDHNIIREGVTINRGTEKEDGVTSVGNHNFLMACCHVAHDCKLGNHIVIANGTLLGGHVHVHDHASLSGAVAVHHYASIGSYSFISGCSRVLHDVPPFMLVEGHPARPRCINVVALKRNDFSPEVINCLAEAHRLLYRAKVGLDHAREILRGNDQLVPQVNELLSFIQIAAGRQARPGPRTQESRVNKLRLAVVGAGHLGRIHARLLAAMPDVELVGVVDPVAAAREHVAAECRTRAFADHRELLAASTRAVIATPTRHHHAVALDFLRHGIPLLVEKPLAPTWPRPTSWSHAAERTDALLQVGHIERFNPAFTGRASSRRRAANTSKPCAPAATRSARPISASCST